MNRIILASVKKIGNPFIRVMDKFICKKGGFHFEPVSDCFYRGSDASVKEIPMLAKKGIKTIINLKTISRKNFEELSAEAQKWGIKYLNIPINPLNPKKTEPDVIKAIKKISPENPTFAHCTLGKDRTGEFTGIERYLNEGMPMYKVIADMRAHGFNTFHRVIFFPVEQYLRNFAKKTPIT